MESPTTRRIADVPILAHRRTGLQGPNLYGRGCAPTTSFIWAHIPLPGASWLRTCSCADGVTVSGETGLRQPRYASEGEPDPPTSALPPRSARAPGSLARHTHVTGQHPAAYGPPPPSSRTLGIAAGIGEPGCACAARPAVPELAQHPYTHRICARIGRRRTSYCGMLARPRDALATARSVKRTTDSINQSRGAEASSPRIARCPLRMLRAGPERG